MQKWKPISQLPKAYKTNRRMFNVITMGDNPKHTPEPVAVWLERDSFIRWPWTFDPTHFCELPTSYEFEAEADPEPVKEQREYEVKVCRIAYSYRTFTITAYSQDEAEVIALEDAGSHCDYSEKDAAYEIVS